MSLKLTFVLSFFLLFHNAYAFNITQVLNKYPEFSTFNTYLTQTNLASQINSRQSITVLVVDNGNLSPLSGKSVDVLMKVLSVHVVLDYFDIPKLQTTSGQSTIVTTLFQTTGIAKGQQGFINITHIGASSVAFSSAVLGSPIGSSLVRSVASQPYNISVLQVSNVIVPEGIDGVTNSTTSPSPSTAPSASPKTSPTPTASPAKSPSKASPAKSPSMASPAKSPSMASPAKSPSMAPPAKSPSMASPAKSPSKASQPSGKAPAPSDARSSSKAPSSSPAAAPGAAPTSDAPAAVPPAPDAPVADKPSDSAATALHIGIAAVFTMAVSTIFLN